jgi:hypothetical protein
LGRRQELDLGDRAFALYGFGRSQLHDVDDSQVHLSDLGRVVVDQSNNPMRPRRRNLNLLINLSLYTS